MVIEDRVEWLVVRLGLEVVDEARRKAQPHGGGARLQRGQRAVVKAAAVAQAVAARPVATVGTSSSVGTISSVSLGLGMP